MLRHPFTHLTAVAVALLGLLLPAAAAAQYSAVDLGTLGGVFSVAHDINKRGQIVGRASLNTGAQHAFLWEDGVMRDLGTLPGGSFSEAYGINDRGQVIGWSTIDEATCTLFDGCWHAFLWEDGTMTDLGGVDDRFQSYAYAINKRGDIAGIGNIADYPFDSWHAILWIDGAANDLGSVAGASNTYARGVNAHADVAGSWDDAGGSHAALWTEGSLFALPALPGATFTEAYKINDRGVLVGVSGSRAVQWVDGAIQDLGALPGAVSSVARNVNNRGEVVGESLANGSGYSAFVWQNGAMIALGTPSGGGQSYANGINDRGDIVGMWDNGSRTHAVLWVKR
jgi:probable HAF family extracellular repeat protein